VPQESKILLIYTGGTIGMIENPDSGSYLPFSIEHLLEYVPQLSKMKVELNIQSFSAPLDSAHIGPKEWLIIKDLIAHDYDNYDGFVVLHGTDTMSYSASALGFLLQGLTKPVVFTGSQLPISKVRSDAQENLITAIEIASAKKNGMPRVPEVSILFDNNLYRGVRSVKHNAENFDAFLSPNYPVLAKAGVRIQYFDSVIESDQSQAINFLNQVDQNVVLLQLFPGIDERYIESILEGEWVKGVVLETFGTGTVNLSKRAIQSIKKAIHRGVIILANSQCNVGSVELGRYEASSIVTDLGILSGWDLTTEAALTKLMVAFGNYSEEDEIKSILRKNWSGEMTIS
jgi:L-asparaginase